jgi:hypothetical protein
VRHRTLSGAPATSVGRWVLTVGALTGEASGLSVGAPDRSCRLSGAPSARSLTLARTVAHLMRLQSTVGAKFRCSAGTPDSPVRHRTLSDATPDSPVNYSGAASRIPEGEQFGVGVPGAPNTVRWHTGQSGAPDQGTLRLTFALYI